MKSEKPEIISSPYAYTADELAVDIGVNVFAARTKKGWTQTQLAKKMKTVQPSIARIELGNTIPSLDFLLRIAKALGTGVVAPTFEATTLFELSHNFQSRISIVTHSSTNQPPQLSPLHETYSQQPYQISYR